VNEDKGYKALMTSPSISTALIPYIGYHKAAGLARLMKEDCLDIFEANRILKTIDEKKLEMILKPGNLLKLGFSLDDII
jgi:aspartate ammonia-lyase